MSHSPRVTGGRQPNYVLQPNTQLFNRPILMTNHFLVSSHTKPYGNDVFMIAKFMSSVIGTVSTMPPKSKLWLHSTEINPARLPLVWEAQWLGELKQNQNSSPQMELGKADQNITSLILRNCPHKFLLSEAEMFLYYDYTAQPFWKTAEFTLVVRKRNAHWSFLAMKREPKSIIIPMRSSLK